ncbi:MAG TPA: MBL fold metallo-hydrolase [Thermoleophilaceae bacterium]|nr:MBL fold metallo-hydrolase [Thermoleophilaceae bacterium]
MKVKVWGARGSVPAPGPETAGYGGNTSCVQITAEDGTEVVLDAGTGIRGLGLALQSEAPRVNILLTHLHLDHIQGLMFFAPAFQPASELLIWGPSAPEATLQDRIARYISAPLTPVEVRELPCSVAFLDAPDSEWRIGPLTVRSASVAHRGPTLGFRVSEGDASVAYIPDHEPALGAPLDDLEDEWISGIDLARGASILIHDAQYTDDEYPQKIGWGHSALSDTLTFARRAEAQRLLLFHHDPMHSDGVLDAMAETAASRWEELGGEPGSVEMAVELEELSLEPARR